MGLNMPEKVKKDALGPGYYTLSQEILASYAGDYVVLSRSSGTESTTYSDPVTMEYLLNIFKEGFLGKKMLDSTRLLFIERALMACLYHS